MIEKPVIVEDRVSDPFQFSGYYYSKIGKLIESIGYHKIAYSPEDWEKGDIIIFNYPQPKKDRDGIRIFKERYIEKIDSLIKEGRRVIFTGYYNNEDGVCDAINSVSKNYGIKILDFVVEDDENCFENDEKMVITSKINEFNKNVEKILLGYCAPVRAREDAEIFVESENGEGMAGYYKDDSGGMLVVIGTCVYWDNYSIDKFDNFGFSRNLIEHKVNSYI